MKPLAFQTPLKHLHNFIDIKLTNPSLNNDQIFEGIIATFVLETTLAEYKSFGASG
jgi:hypothetical protein